VNVRLSIVALALFAVSVHGETPAPEPAGNALDAARRDLRALPATEKSRDGLGKSPGSASLPTLTIPASDETQQSKPEEPNAPPSPTWLLDALSKADAERSQRRPGPDATLVRDQPNGDKRVQAKDPLAQYLGQWMAPRDLELLRPDAKKTTEQATTSPQGLTVQTTDQTFLSGAQEGVMSSAALGEPAKNPYLQEAEPVPSPANPFSPTGSTNALANDRGRVPPALPAPPSADLPAKSDLRKPAAAALEQSPVSPAAPIIDSGKYFPQLRRF
jgi:hypothetical protein